MDLIVGVIIGWVSLYIAGIAIKSIRQKKGLKDKKYKNWPLTVKLKDTVRHIIFEYDIKRNNNDFLLNINLDERQVMQIMHRAHFPELSRSESDIKFGLALYIPTSNLPEYKIKILEAIIEEESETLKGEIHSGTVNYFVIDLGKRVRYGGYLLARVIKEVFEKEEGNMSLELFSEGNLPYHLN